MHFIWVGYKYPVVITSDCRYIVMFDIRARTQLCSSCFESRPDGFLGAFDLSLSAFIDRCGIVIQEDGTISLNLRCDHKDKLNGRFKKRLCGCGSHCTQSAQDDAQDKGTCEICGGV